VITKHSAASESVLTVLDTARAERGSDFARLSRRIAKEGLLDKRPGYYAARIGLVAALFAGTGDSWWQTLVAVLLAVAFAQVTLLAHDLAHGQISRSRRTSRIAGLLVGNLAVGLSYGWWMDKHTRHHANPNHEDHDPDVSPEILIWSQRQAEAARGVARIVGRRQALLFFPLLTLEGVNLKISSFRALRRPSLKNRTTEGLLLGAHVLAYLGAVFLVLPPGKALVFLAVHQACYGVYLGCTFAPNHKGMPVLTAEDELDFLRRQVLTSRNVRGGRLVTTALGGLNYQIEHHLFDYCRSIGVDYAECGLFASWGQALRHLHEVGRPLRRVGSR
jgi:fatty acid desaturase